MRAKVSSRAGDSRLSVRKTNDINKPKRPLSTFSVFMEGFMKEYKENHPNVTQVSVIRKAGDDRWKSLSDGEKAEYVAKAEKLRAEYTKKIDADNNPQPPAGGSEASSHSDKSKSVVYHKYYAAKRRRRSPSPPGVILIGSPYLEYLDDLVD